MRQVSSLLQLFAILRKRGDKICEPLPSFCDCVRQSVLIPSPVTGSLINGFVFLWGEVLLQRGGCQHVVLRAHEGWMPSSSFEHRGFQSPEASSVLGAERRVRRTHFGRKAPTANLPPDLRLGKLILDIPTRVRPQLRALNFVFIAVRRHHVGLCLPRCCFGSTVRLVFQQSSHMGSCLGRDLLWATAFEGFRSPQVLLWWVLLFVGPQGRGFPQRCGSNTLAVRAHSQG